MIFIPLYSFHSNIKVFQITDYITLKKIEDYTYITSIMDKDFFSNKEIESIYQCTHLLEISDSYRKFIDLPNPISKIDDIFLHASWIQKSFRLFIKFIFGHEISTISSNLQTPYAARILHRKRRNEYEESIIKMELEDLTNIKSNFCKLTVLYNKPSRLQLAATFTFWGILSMTWIEAYITFMTSFEFLLTHKSSYGVKKKLALACACILEDSDSSRNNIYTEFCKLYNFRSDIIHGKSQKNIDENGYEYLSRLSNLLRETWQRVLSDPTMIIMLQKSDTGRKGFIKSIQKNFEPIFIDTLSKK
ncbi:MAG: HEPN domain-containing protein [Candidatus Cloacimonetes bacterium]|jgi:hypothetical protein|nr:HEPN domain-containing protein [Candidatus Cloacimonadota bacterium]